MCSFHEGINLYLFTRIESQCFEDIYFLKVCTNGILSFTRGISSYSLGQFSEYSRAPVIAPFSSDVDIRAVGRIHYG